MASIVALRVCHYDKYSIYLYVCVIGGLKVDSQCRISFNPTSWMIITGAVWLPIQSVLLSVANIASMYQNCTITIHRLCVNHVCNIYKFVQIL